MGGRLSSIALTECLLLQSGIRQDRSFSCDETVMELSLFIIPLSGSTLIIASEQKAIIQHPSVKREIDLEGLIEYFTFQNIFTDRTLLKGIRIFPAGCFAQISLGKLIERLQPVPILGFRFPRTRTSSFREEYVEELDRLFRQAVNRQLVSDVEVGSYLSGGMDSGSITAVAATQLP